MRVVGEGGSEERASDEVARELSDDAAFLGAIVQETKRLELKEAGRAKGGAPSRVEADLLAHG